MNLPANCRPLYRILTKKSKLGFGKYADLTVGDVMKINPPYLEYLYYCHEQISFCKEIMEELDLEPIAKPGKDEERLKERDRAKSAKYTAEQRMHGWMKIRRTNKKIAILKMLDAEKKANYTKEILQAGNHGHFNLEDRP